MNLFFRLRSRVTHATPHTYRPKVPVNVTLTLREPAVDGLDWTQPDAVTVAHIGKHLPSPPSTWTVSRTTLVQRAFIKQLGATGCLSEADRAQLIAALEAGTEHLDRLDRLVRAKG